MTRPSLFVTFYASYCTKNTLFYAVQRIYCIKSEKSHNNLNSLHCKTKNNRFTDFLSHIFISLRKNRTFARILRNPAII